MSCNKANNLSAQVSDLLARLSLSPFLAFLGLRRDAYIFQDKDSLEINSN